MSLEDNEPRFEIEDPEDEQAEGLTPGEIDEILNRPVEPYPVPERNAPAPRRQEA